MKKNLNAVRLPIIDHKPQRNFILGDSWLYYKIYTGCKTADTVLAQIIKPISEQLIADGIIDKWFFIRYGQPKHHIRVRFHYTNPDQLGTVINLLYPHLRVFTNQDLIWKIETDTYQREIERYGAVMDVSESLFFHESKMIVDFINMTEGDRDKDLRWLFSIRAMDSYLNIFEYTDEQKLSLLNGLKIRFRKEFDDSRALGKQLDTKYRAESKKIEAFMMLNENDNPDYIPILNILKKKEEDISPIVPEILRHREAGSLQIDFSELMSSYLHMLMNRLFKSKSRMHEMVCYDFLYRYYRSRIARRKKSGSIKNRT